jgi:hypothetical protein
MYRRVGQYTSAPASPHLCVHRYNNAEICVYIDITKMNCLPSTLSQRQHRREAHHTVCVCDAATWHRNKQQQAEVGVCLKVYSGVAPDTRLARVGAHKHVAKSASNAHCTNATDDIFLHSANTCSLLHTCLLLLMFSWVRESVMFFLTTATEATHRTNTS